MLRPRRWGPGCGFLNLISKHALVTPSRCGALPPCSLPRTSLAGPDPGPPAHHPSGPGSPVSLCPVPPSRDRSRALARCGPFRPCRRASAGGWPLCSRGSPAPSSQNPGAAKPGRPGRLRPLPRRPSTEPQPAPVSAAGAPRPGTGGSGPGPPGHNRPFHAEPPTCGVSDSALSPGGAERGVIGVPLSSLSLHIASFQEREKGYQVPSPRPAHRPGTPVTGGLCFLRTGVPGG